MEIWKDIKNYENYQVSNLGRVKTKHRVFTRSNESSMTIRERIKNQHLSKKGYRIVSLSKNNKSHNKQVHQLVAVAFLNHVCNGHKLVVDHIDENKQNNKLSNLQILTNRANCVKSMDKSNMTSKYVGVTFCKKSRKYSASIKLKNKKYYLGSFISEKDASATYKKALQEIKEGKKITIHKAKTSSKHKGVSKTKHTSKGRDYYYWVAYKFVEGKRINLGLHKTENQAYNAILKSN